MLRCAFITVGYPSNEHPALGIFSHRMVKLISESIDVQVIHLRTWRPNRPLVEKREWEGIPVLSLAIPQIPSTSSKWLNAQLLAEFGMHWAGQVIKQADVLYSIGLFPAGYIGSIWSRHYKKPHVSKGIGDDVNFDLLNPRVSGRNKSWLMELDGVSCVSKHILLKLEAIAPGIRNSRVIYRGVDLVKYSPDGNTDGPQAGLPPVRYLFLGGFQTWDPKRLAVENTKGGHILLDAWKKVELKVGSSSLVLGGPGTDFSRLQGSLSTLKRPEAVFIMPTISPDKIPNMLRSCDVVIIPSLNEGLPNLANEAQACARPVLGTDAGGIPETVIHQSTGWIVPKGDVAQLADGIILFFNHQDRIRDFGLRARNHMESNFTQRLSISNEISLIQTAIASRT